MQETSFADPIEAFAREVGSTDASDDHKHGDSQLLTVALAPLPDGDQDPRDAHGLNVAAGPHAEAGQMAYDAQFPLAPSAPYARTGPTLDDLHAMPAGRAILSESGQELCDLHRRTAASEPNAREDQQARDALRCPVSRAPHASEGRHVVDALRSDAPLAPLAAADQPMRDALNAAVSGGDPERDMAIATIRRHHRLDVGFRKLRMGIHARAGAMTRQIFGFNPFLPEAERAKIVKQAMAAAKAWTKGAYVDGVPIPVQDAMMMALASAADSAKPWEVLEAAQQKVMSSHAKQLPGYGWTKTVRGFGITSSLSFARIIGETGDLSNYATVSRVWKRMGLAVIEGERQRKKTDATLAALHGYVPSRRSLMYVIGESLVKGQLRKAGEDDEGSTAIGPYGQAYLDARAKYREREGWTKAHAHNAAKRVMEKELLKHLWLAWRADTR